MSLVFDIGDLFISTSLQTLFIILLAFFTFLSCALTQIEIRRSLAKGDATLLLVPVIIGWLCVIATWVFAAAVYNVLTFWTGLLSIVIPFAIYMAFYAIFTFLGIKRAFIFLATIPGLIAVLWTQIQFVLHGRMGNVRKEIQARVTQIKKVARANNIGQELSERLDWLVKELLPSYLDEEKQLALDRETSQKLYDDNKDGDSKWVKSIKEALDTTIKAHDAVTKQITDLAPFLDSILAGMIAARVDKELLTKLSSRLDEMAQQFKEARSEKEAVQEEVRTATT